MRNNNAVLMGAALFTLLTGCSRYEIVECESEQNEFMRTGASWLKNHSEDVDREMRALWSSPHTVQEIINVVDDARIVCGIGPSDDHVAASRNATSNTIIIDVADDWFQEELERFNEHRWVATYTSAELADPEVIDYAEMSALLSLWSYHLSLSRMGLLLAHEGAHGVLGDHSSAVRRHVRSDSYTGEPDEVDELDEIYAWGFAAELAADAAFNEDRLQLLEFVEE